MRAYALNTDTLKSKYQMQIDRHVVFSCALNAKREEKSNDNQNILHCIYVNGISRMKSHLFR